MHISLLWGSFWHKHNKLGGQSSGGNNENVPETTAVFSFSDLLTLNNLGCLFVVWFLVFFFYFFYFLKKSLFLRERKRQSVSGGGAQREGDTESEGGSRLRVVSTEPSAGLELTNRAIMTRARVGCSTDGSPPSAVKTQNS